MARSGVMSVLFFFALLRGGFAATLHAESASVVRREPSRVSMGPRGSMVQIESGSEPMAHFDSDLMGEFCNRDYPAGKDKSSNCTNHGEDIIEEEELCMQAATESGAHVISGKFKIGEYPWQSVRPKGCFKEECTESSNGVCYFFNGIGEWPNPADSRFTGQPICQRPKLLNGTKNKNYDCPTGYGFIDDEQTCRGAVNCLGLDPSPIFLLGSGRSKNGSKHLDFVRGCVFDEETSQVFFNPKTDLGDCPADRCRGIQICNVTSITTWGPGSSDTDPGHVTEGEKADKLGEDAKPAADKLF